MKHILRFFIITSVSLLLMLLIMLIGLSLWLQTDSARQMVFQVGIDLLQDKLQTKVTAKRISLELLKGQVRIYGMEVNDQEDSLLLHIDQLHVGIVPHELLDHKIHVTDVELLGADTRLWKDSLTSNFQFVIDAFKKNPNIKKNNKSPKMQLLLDVKKANLQRLYVKWDVRNKPRKNIGRPNRGAFDANHIDAMLNINASITQPSKDKYDICIENLNLYDNASGLCIDKLSTKASIDKQNIQVDKLFLKSIHSSVNISKFTIDLKNKQIQSPFTLTAYVVLQDISQPFAPVLSHFTTPLQLKTQVSGPLKSLNLENIQIQTPDKHLSLVAKGTLNGLFGHKEGLNLQFRNIDMRAKDSMKEQLVMHFAKKMRLKMLRQMKALGDIRFLGSLDVLYKREIFAGRLDTRFGHLTTRFTINDSTRFMTGYLETPSMDMGRLMNIAQLDPVKCRIDFNLNISRKSKRPATALPNGRLPMGTITAKVFNPKYSTIQVPEVRLQLSSDGSTATGNIWLPGLLKGLSAHVHYVQTDYEQKMWFHITHDAQQWLLKESVALLSEKLNADVSADSINMQIFDGEAKIYGIKISSLPFLSPRPISPRPIRKGAGEGPEGPSGAISLDSLTVSLDAQQLLRHTLHITRVGIYGLQAQFNNDSIATNFRTILQAFKKNKKHGSSSHPSLSPRPTSPRPIRKGSGEGPEGPEGPRGSFMQLVVDLQDIEIQRMQITSYTSPSLSSQSPRPIRKGQGEGPEVAGGRSGGGFAFLLNLQAGIKQTGKDEYTIDLRKLDIKDLNTGLKLDDIHTHAVLSKDMLHLDGIYLQMRQSKLSIDPLTFNLKDKSFLQPFMIYGHIVLQDIAQPFVPILSNFTIPIDLQAVVSGNLNNLQLADILIHTPGEAMNITARSASLHISPSLSSQSPRPISPRPIRKGQGEGPEGPEGAGGRSGWAGASFADVVLNTSNKMLLDLVMQFSKTVRLKMIRQLQKMGDVRFEGNLEILPKRENVSGSLDTEFGNVKTDFSLDDATHTLSGYIDAPALQIGKFLDVKHLRDIDAHINFSFNTSAKAPHPATALPNGRLPQGVIQATVRNVKYGILRVKRIETTINSDGSTATGSVVIPRIMSDLIVNFNYIQTDELHHLKVRPKVRLHNFFKRKKKKNQAPN